jgi:hypothetical protein
VASVKENVHGVVDKGKAVIDNQKASISEGVEAGKQAYHEKKDKLTAQVESTEESK